MTSSTDFVLGSGPAGVACAAQLLDAGRSVVMIDPNRRLDAGRQKLAEDFRANPERENFVARMRHRRAGLPRDLQDKKLPFASPYIYQQVDRFLPVEMHDAVVTRSLASGGLSAVWGATVIPFSASSFQNWPVTQGEMAPFYRMVAELMDVPCPHDDLETLYPNYGWAAPLPLSEQGSQLMSRMLNRREHLTQAGIAFGRGRSAISKSCVGCGLCMYGCPYGAIFNAESVVDALKNRSGFTCIANKIAEGYEENGNAVRVHLRDIDSGVVESMDCQRVFIACGASTSLRLVAGAMRWFEHEFSMQDTQQFSIPVLLSSRCQAGAIPEANALSQIFIELKALNADDAHIHLQVYGYNPFLADILRARYGRLINQRLMQPLLDRMMIVMGYLPGALSGRIAMTVRPNADGLPGLACRGIANAQSVAAINAVGKKLAAHCRDFGFLPLLPLTEIPMIGTSVHLAACLPMKDAPCIGETDRLGRPFGSRRAHVVDGACFSTLPSEHLTYTIMANAARIAHQSTAEIA
jgi:ferredoxin